MTRKFSKTAAQIVAEERGISQEEAVEFLKRQYVSPAKKNQTDRIFDWLVARQHLLLEAFGFLNDGSDNKGYAVHQTMTELTRDAQDKLKEIHEELKEQKIN